MMAPTKIWDYELRRGIKQGTEPIVSYVLRKQKGVNKAFEFL